MRFFPKLCVILSALVSFSCSVAPLKDVKVIDHFSSDKYLGTWYEIARLDHSFERGLEHVTANYSPRADGGLKVVNRGFDSKTQQWQQSVGKAYFIGSPQVAALKVSFFGPFYGGYNVIDLDPDYSYALVAGPNRDYLWILSRTPTLSMETRDKLLQVAKDYGFNTAALIWVNQQAAQ